MANEPTLGELSNMRVDSSLGGGVPVPVIDNSNLVNTLNNAARDHAQNTWNKYQQFLQNKTDLFKNISDIEGLETLPEDRDALRKQAADVLSDILKNPSVALGGAGYDELQSKISKFKQDTMLSKQNLLDNKTNKMFIERNPDLDTPDNRKLMDNFVNTPLGQRKSVLLQLPTILDERGLFEDALKNSTHPYSAVVGKDGKAGEGYIESGLEVNPNAIQGQMGLSLEAAEDKYGHSIKGAVQSNFNRLPDEQKKSYEDIAKANGTDALTEYWKDKTGKYLNAYLPAGSYSPTPEGNYRFGKSLKPDPAYLGQQKLALDQAKLSEKTAYDKANLDVKWANYGISKERLQKEKKEDLGDAGTVINEATSIINNGKPVTVVGAGGVGRKEVLRVSDPTLLQKFGNVDKEGKTTMVPDALNFDPKSNQVTLIYGKSNKNGGFGTSEKPTKEIPLDQRTWLKIITSRSFPNKNIGSVNQLIEAALKANGNSIYKMSQKNNEATSENNNESGTQKQVKTLKIKGTNKKLY